jgi:two-component system, chemotaxis family, chemotaxis protein CheY
MPHDDSGRNLIRTLKKIAIFDGLSPTGIRKLLSICESRSVSAAQQLCLADTTSDEMYVLLGGELSILTAEGLRVATIEPVAAVGIGVITGELRTAAIVTSKHSQILVIPKRPFDRLLHSDRHVAGRIYRNFIGIVAQKLTNDNIRLRHMQQEKQRDEERLSQLERRVRTQEHLVLAVDDLLLRHGIDPVPAEEPVPDAPLRVLIVDDEAEFRRLINDALPELEVIQAEHGKDALERIGENLPDLVITDINMPVMNGVELLKTLRQDYPDLPVVAISGHIDTGSLREFGFDGYIGKPLKLKAFRKMVQDILTV